MVSRGWARTAIAAMGTLPLNALSRAGGRAATLRLPAPLQRAEIRLFGRAVGVDFDEARDPIDSFASLQEFFTRALREGARPADGAPDAFVAPCDGAWGSAGDVVDGTILQVKGRPYSVAALLGSEDDAREFEGGCFATFYLAPRDYHRFHVPADVTVTRARYQPGALWPVNAIGLEGVDGLFAENERICAHMQLRDSGASICLVAVGATMVGSVRVVFDDLVTNRPGAVTRHRDYRDADVGEPTPPNPNLEQPTLEPTLEKGEEWGRFEFGSTIVLLAAPGAIALDIQPPGHPLRLGARVGTLLPAPQTRDRKRERRSDAG